MPRSILLRPIVFLALVSVAPLPFVFHSGTARAQAAAAASTSPGPPSTPSTAPAPPTAPTGGPPAPTGSHCYVPNPTPPPFAMANPQAVNSLDLNATLAGMACSFARGYHIGTGAGELYARVISARLASYKFDDTACTSAGSSESNLGLEVSICGDKVSGAVKEDYSFSAKDCKLPSTPPSPYPCICGDHYYGQSTESLSGVLSLPEKDLGTIRPSEVLGALATAVVGYVPPWVQRVMQPVLGCFDVFGKGSGKWSGTVNLDGDLQREGKTQTVCNDSNAWCSKVRGELGMGLKASGEVKVDSSGVGSSTHFCNSFAEVSSWIAAIRGSSKGEISFRSTIGGSVQTGQGLCTTGGCPTGTATAVANFTNQFGFRVYGIYETAVRSVVRCKVEAKVRCDGTTFSPSNPMDLCSGSLEDMDIEDVAD